MDRLLNTSTWNGGVTIFDNDWNRAVEFLKHWEFDGYELYPIGNNDYGTVPSGIVKGIHLRFFVILTPLWREDRKRLIEIFGSMEGVTEYYGGNDANCLKEFYTSQFNLAQELGAYYVVFHPVHCEFEYIYDWKFPWTIEETLDVSTELMDAAVKDSNYTGYILFENLWWPGSFVLDHAWEYEYILSKMNYEKCGITLDTGHMMNRNFDLQTEAQAIDYICSHLDDLGKDVRDAVKNVHLTCSLSGDYIKESMKSGKTFKPGMTLNEKFHQAYGHVSSIDRHEPFHDRVVEKLYDKINPLSTVFEFTYGDVGQWQDKIAPQKRALQRRFWPDYAGDYEHITFQKNSHD